MVAVTDLLLEDAPGVEWQDRRERRGRLDVDQRIRNDRKLAVMLREIEVMDLIAQVVLDT